MHPIEKFHSMVLSGKVLSSGGQWLPLEKALKVKKTQQEHLFAGEIESEGQWIQPGRDGTGKTSVGPVQPAVRSHASSSVPAPLSFPERNHRSTASGTPVSRTGPDSRVEGSAGPAPGFDDDDVIHLDPSSVQDTPGEVFSFPTENETTVNFKPPPFIKESIETQVHKKEPAPQADISVVSKRTQPPPPSPPEATTDVRTRPATPMSPDETYRHVKDAAPVAEGGTVSKRSDPPPFLSPVSRIAEKEDARPAAPFERETITIRTIPLGKDATLTVSESRAGAALVAICSVQGFIDQSNADDFQVQLVSMLDFGVRYFIIDFENTTLIGSAGWGMLAVTSRLITTSQGHLLICALKEEIEESFLLLQFNEVIDSRKTISDCLDVITEIIARPDCVQAENTGGTAVFPQYTDTYEELPLPEKIKMVISQNGPLSLFRIAAMLKTDRYGKTSINPVKLYLLLKEMNLDTKVKRTRYYRSC